MSAIWHSSHMLLLRVKLMCLWYDIAVPKTYFSHREFSFTLKDDIYVRYLSFADIDEFEKELQKRCPYKIDIGAVFSNRVDMHLITF